MNVYSVSTLAFRQTSEHRAALELPVHARRPGRYHDRGDPSPLYASSSPLAQRTSATGTVMGLRAPSAATEGAITFVIFHQHLQQVVLTEEYTVRIVDYLDPPPDPRSASRSAP